jgi:L-ribulose-5-phosphate 4-epimerase
MLESIKEELHWLHLELPKQNLVTWTSGNISARDPQSGLVVIKPSGIRYEDLRPEHMVVRDPGGRHRRRERSSLRPTRPATSTSTATGPTSTASLHTHSRYATAFAANGMSIPVYLTAQADEFGGPIPCGGFALIGGEEIGQVVIEAIGSSPAVLLKNHGVFTVGPSAKSAFKAAVMVEDVAATVWLALQLGQPDRIADEDVAKLHYRYTHIYGQ